MKVTEAQLTSDERLTLEAAASSDDGCYWIGAREWRLREGDYVVCHGLHMRGLMTPEPRPMRFKITPAGLTLLQDKE